MNQCPLLLRYKFRNFSFGEEVEMDMNLYKVIEPWKNIPDGQNRKLWKLRKHLIPEFLTDSDGHVRYFSRAEFHAIGDPDNPIVIHFAAGNRSLCSKEEASSYRLPGRYRYATRQDTRWDQISFEDNVRRVLHEYERHRGKWETRVVIEKEMMR